MSKRNPTSELNHDNWDAEDDKEDAGRFTVASKETIKKREIRVAKRRNVGEEKGTGGLFKSFTGFSGFGSEASTGGGAAGFAFGSQPKNQQQQQADSGSSKSNNNNGSGAANANHLSQLKALNQSVLNWIRTHVTDNPYCVLTPIFRDYERHLASIEKKFPYEESPDGDGVGGISGGGGGSELSGFKFSASPTNASAAKPAAATTVASSVSGSAASFNSAAAATTPSLNFAGNVKDFVFNAKPAEEPEPPKQAASTSLFGFSFAAGANTAGSAAAKPAFSLLGSSGQQQQEAKDEEEEYEPPKPETREINEAGAVHTKRCKLFYMAPDTKEWRDKGVGNLHVKPAEAAGKVQLIVRADNNLGTILLNTLVNKEMSLTTTKNNLNLACVPNPPLASSKDSEPRIVPFLVKVKTEADAKELLRHLDDERNK